MGYIFDVAHLSVERLLENWRWLCPEPVILHARNAFGDLFLQKESGRVFKLDVSVGRKHIIGAFSIRSALSDYHCPCTRDIH